MTLIIIILIMIIIIELTILIYNNINSRLTAEADAVLSRACRIVAPRPVFI